MKAVKTTTFRVREHRRAAGLKPLAIYATPQDHAAVRADAERLQSKRAKEGQHAGVLTNGRGSSSLELLRTN